MTDKKQLSGGDALARVAVLETELAQKSLLVREMDLMFGRMLLGMRAAVIEEEHGKGAEAAMVWIFNGLVGPGELPPEEETDAQAYFNREVEAIDEGMKQVIEERKALGAAPAPVEQAPHPQGTQAISDAITTGRGFMSAGKRVPPEDVYDLPVERCDTCHGNGEVPTGETQRFGDLQPPEPVMMACPDCDGQAPVEQQDEWEHCQSIADCPEVDAVLQAFADDPTSDQGVMIVREVLRAATPERPLQCHECADRVALEAGAKAISDQFLAALRRLTLAARTSGGTASPDSELMAACEQAERAISIAGAGSAFTEAADLAVRELYGWVTTAEKPSIATQREFWLRSESDDMAQWLEQMDIRGCQVTKTGLYTTIPQAAPAPTAAQDVAGLVDALSRLERACDRRSALLTSEVYRMCSLIPGMDDALLELQDARKQARGLLDAHQNGGPES